MNRHRRLIVIGGREHLRKGVANGYASLDVSGKVPVSQIPTNSSIPTVNASQDALWETLIVSPIANSIDSTVVYGARYSNINTLVNTGLGAGAGGVLPFQRGAASGVYYIESATATSNASTALFRLGKTAIMSFKISIVVPGDTFSIGFQSFNDVANYTAPGQFMKLHYTGGQYYFATANGAGATSQNITTQMPASNTSPKITLVYNIGNDCKCYINGTLVSTLSARVPGVGNGNYICYGGTSTTSSNIIVSPVTVSYEI